jgi:ribosomal protein S12 methylthiotransferase
MRRGGSRESFTRMIGELRRRVPDLSLRTTFIAGFPGETEEEFEELRSFVEEIEFDHIGVFTYSHEPGAPSFPMVDDVSPSLKSDRRQVLLDLQEGISMKRYRGRVGKTLDVLIEGRGPEPGTWSGRAAFQAPEVDGDVVVHGLAGSREFAAITIEEAVAYQLVGRALPVVT